jgi:LacI family transcriptional regulator
LQKITVRDVADHVNLSISTVSRALTGHPHVDEQTRLRVRAAARQLGYQPNALARALRSNQTKTIGLVIPDIMNAFYAASATVLQAALEQQGYRLILCISNNDPGSDARYLTALMEQQVDGIIHVPSTSAGAGAVRDFNRTVPVVELARHSQGGLFDAVIADDREGALQLTRHLLELGHRRIAFIGGPQEVSTTQDRIAGFREGFQEVGFLPDHAAIGLGGYSSAWGSQRTHELLKLPERPTALFATSNQILLGVLRALSQEGLDIPGDISVVGIDDPEWCAAWHPPITTYALPLSEMGLLAAQLLLARLASAGAPFSPTITRLSGKLTIRESVASLVQA